jgi:hypothetical protein
MNKTIATTALSLLTLGSLGLTLPSKVEALTAHNSNPVVAELPTTPEPVLEAGINQDQATQEIAYGVYCESFTDGYRIYNCCLDSDGNWVCVW